MMRRGLLNRSTVRRHIDDYARGTKIVRVASTFYGHPRAGPARRDPPAGPAVAPVENPQGAINPRGEESRRRAAQAPPLVSATASSPDAHRCHAKDCRAVVPPRIFMCRRHWFMVPKTLRDAVWAAYRQGQEIDKDPSPAYRDAAHEAIWYVARREAHAVPSRTDSRRGERGRRRDTP
jgi:hypothetical protein